MTEPKKRSWIATYKGWHTDDDRLWREIYARTTSTLLAAFIAYLIAIVAVGADPAPLRLILLVVAIILLAIAQVGFIRRLDRSALRIRRREVDGSYSIYLIKHFANTLAQGVFVASPLTVAVALYLIYVGQGPMPRSQS